MQGTSWITLFRRIPVNLHEHLALYLSNGLEVLVQKILKLEDDVVILRGRLSGTQDGGRITMIPYSYLMTFALNKRLTDAEVEAVFGKDGQGYAADLVLSAAAETPEIAEEAEPEPEKTSAKAAAAKAALPSKAELLAKLRSRLGDGARRGRMI